MPEQSNRIVNKQTVHVPHKRRRRYWRRLLNHTFYGLQRFFYHMKVHLLRLIKRFLRFCYRVGPAKCLYVSGVAAVALVALVLLISIPKSRARKADAVAVRSAAPTPTLVPLVTVAPEQLSAQQPAEITPEPTPELRLEKGDQSADVTRLQQRLMELGYLGIDEPTDYFGNATKSAVQLFQRQHELDQDGIAGPTTLTLLYGDDAKPYVMYEGAEGDDIEDFQEMLYDLGYLERNQITGYYGTDTLSAVKKFQKRNHLTSDGKAGERTLEMINSPDARVSYTKEKEIEEEKAAAKAAAYKKTAEGRIDSLISIAKKQLGKPYILGDRGPDSYDCSGLVYYCLRQADVYTRRLNASGFSKTSGWKKITDMDDIKRGDLLFFKSDDSSYVGHVGIYVGSGEMIDASSANGKVVRRSCRTSYWRRNFVCARRPIE